MDFPHLSDTQFPNLENVDVFRHKVIFDYKRWVPNTKVYICNVRWNGDYSDCVKFDSDDARNKWFDELIENNKVNNPDCSIVLKSAQNFIGDTVKVPVPYDRATQFNYMVVDIPVMTSDDQLLPYETEDGYRRWHFFIDDYSQESPSTTALNVRLDYWTQYINSVGFNYFLLERGHAPVKATDTDVYLENPVENNEYLLTPDVNYGNDTNAQGAKFIPFGNGEKYICFASTCTPSQLSSIGTVSTGSSYSYSDPIFSDESGYPNNAMRWGKQYHVDGFGFGSGKSYANVNTPTGNTLSNDGRIPNNVSVYAVRAQEASSFINNVMNSCPTFLKTIVACFMVAKELITLGTSHSLNGNIMYECVGNESKLCDVKLTKDMFNIPEKYQKYTKLYTYPYSELEVTDNNGKSVTVRVEQTGSISAHGIVSVAYPYLNMRMFLTGIGGTGSETYQWQDLRGSHDCEISNSDWYRFCYDMEVPMYSLYMDGKTSWEITNYNRSISNAKNSALVNYHNSVREANNACNNSKDSASTNYSNAVDSANTAQSNTNNAANTQRTNTYNDATCTDNNNANTRACASSITSTNNATNTSNTATSNQLQIDHYEVAQNRDNVKATIANTVSLITTEENNEVTQTTANSSTTVSIASAAGGAVSAIASGAAAAATGGASAVILGSGLGGLSGIAGNVAEAICAQTNAQSVINASDNIRSAQGRANFKYVANDYNNNVSDTGYANNAASNINAHNCACATSNTNDSNECNRKNTNNTTGTMRTNATNTRDMLVTNASNTRNMAVTNAGRTNDNAKSNANWTDEAAIASAQDILRNTQNASKATSNDANNANPILLCPTSGDATPDYMRTRGIQLKVRTQSKNAIRATGDEFVRYGYALNQIWEINSLCLMNHFTYWKAKDCWVYDICETSDLAQLAIAGIFKQGVTVWSDPTEIGRVNPYGN